MNSLSILGRNPSPTQSRSRSSSYAGVEVVESKETDDLSSVTSTTTANRSNSTAPDAESNMDFTEESPLLGTKPFGDVNTSGWRSYPKRISSGIVGTIRVVMTTITAPIHYVITCFYDEEGQFSIIYPVVAIYHTLTPRRRRRAMQEEAYASEKAGKAPPRDNGTKRNSRRLSKPPNTISASSSAVYSDSELDEKLGDRESTPARNTRSQSNSSTSGDEISPQRRSIRIKLHNEEALKKRRRQQQEAKVSDAKDVVAASLKSPSSPLSSSVKSLTRFPKAPQAPRPLIPRRQPSYTKAPAVMAPRQKTLIIDLDETLIHSQSKGGRFATGHMIEVKMNHTVGVGGVTLGPQVPILYFVHKRPHCDEFLRKVQKWYKLVVFTASVQEYADPVIDWLEMERRYFDARYYRQHCTMRNGAYIKDLAQVEPDLSKVMILDNSPLSYVFNEDNAVPIEGWISDPTDNDLMHLIPMLEALQYCTDVRAVLSLRLGQPQVEA